MDDESDFERPTADDEWGVPRLLRARRDDVLARGEEANGAELVFDALKFRHDVYRRLPNVAPVGDLNAWPEYIHDAEEQAESFKQRQIDLDDGDDPNEVLGIKDRPTRHQITTAEAIERVFCAHLTGDIVRPRRTTSRF